MFWIEVHISVLQRSVLFYKDRLLKQNRWIFPALAQRALDDRMPFVWAAGGSAQKRDGHPKQRWPNSHAYFNGSISRPFRFYFLILITMGILWHGLSLLLLCLLRCSDGCTDPWPFTYNLYCRTICSFFLSAVALECVCFLVWEVNN